MAEYPSVLNALLARGDRMSSYTPTLREKGVDWLARNWYGDSREGTHKAEKLSNVLETVTPYGMATMGYDAGRALGGGQPVQGALMLGMAGLPLPASIEKKAAQGIRAYHGSPHSFDKFDISKIGTGEGAQAYGHGLYFAENEGVAKSYRDVLSSNTGNPTFDAASKLVAGKGGDKQAAKQRLAENITNIKARIAETSGNVRADWERRLSDEMQSLAAIDNGAGGSMYEVNINANPDDFLDWDKPLPMDHPLRARLSELGEQAAKGENPADRNIGKDVFLAAKNQEMTGEGAYRSMARVLDANRQNLKSKYGEAALFKDSAELANNEIGGAGIKYLDAGSRGGNGTGTRNYVVFDDKLIQIVKKYGIAGASAMLGMNVLANMDDAQAAQLKKAENMGKIQNSLTSRGW